MCSLFVYITTPSYVLLLYLRRFSRVCSDTPPGDDTQFWDSLTSSIDYKNICENTENASHIPLLRMKKLCVGNGNVMRNRGGNRLEGKHSLMFVKL